MPTHRAATYPGEKPSASTVASVEVDPLDPTTSDPVDASGGGYAGGGGGSAFAHLTEDTDTSALVTDWKIGFQNGTDPADTFLSRIGGPGTTTLVGTQQLVVVNDEDDAQGWFDGTPYSGQVAYVAPNGIGITNNAGLTVNLDLVGLSCHTYAGAIPSVDFFSDSGNLFLNQQMLSLGADNGVILMKSPDGTNYSISVSNAGAIVVAPA